MSKTIMVVDTETTSLNPFNGNTVFAISYMIVKNGKKTTGYIDFLIDQKTLKPVYTELQEIDQGLFYLHYIDKTVQKIFHNAKFDIHSIRESLGIKCAGVVHDTMLMAHACNNVEPRLALKPLALKYCGIPLDDEIELKEAVRYSTKIARTLKYKIDYNSDAHYWLPKFFDSKSEVCRTYAIRDVERTYALYELYMELFDGNNSYYTTYQRERKLLKVLIDMEKAGVAIDKEVVKTLQQQALKVMEEEEAFIRTSCSDSSLNINSPIQMRKVFFGTLGYSPLAYTPTGEPQLNQEFLEKIQDNPIAKSLLRYKSASKACSTFFANFLLHGKDQICPDSNKPLTYIHASFRQVGPVTGRLSCSEPNLQTIPDIKQSKSPIPIDGRRPFIPSPGCTLVFMDFSQIEVRIFACVSGDKNLISDIQSGKDIHANCARLAWRYDEDTGLLSKATYNILAQALQLGRPIFDITNPAILKFYSEIDVCKPDTEIAKQFLVERHNNDIVAAENEVGTGYARMKAKLVFFAKIYGGGADSVKDIIGVSRDEARQFLANYDTAFPTIRKTIRKYQNLMQRTGELTNAYGRTLHTNVGEEHKAVNYMVQSSAADLLKLGMIRLARHIKKNELKSRVILTIHDEVVLDVPDSEFTPENISAMKAKLESAGSIFELPIPVKVSYSKTSWAEKTEWKL